MASFEARSLKKTQGHCKCSRSSGKERMEGKKSSETVVLDVYSDRFEDIKDDLGARKAHAQRVWVRD